MTDLTDLIDKEFATKTLAEWGLTFDERGRFRARSQR